MVEPPGLAASRRGRRAAPVEGDAPPGDPVQVQVMRLLEWPGCEGRSQAELSGPHVAVRRRRREPQWQCSGGVGGHTWQCGEERSWSRTWRCGGRRCRATGRTVLGEQRARASGRAVLGEQWARASTAGGWGGVPATTGGCDGPTGAGTMSVLSKNSRAIGETGWGCCSANGKEASSKTTWREMMTLLVARSRQR